MATTSTFAEPAVPPGTVVVAEASRDGLSQYLLDGRHHLLADEPASIGGQDLGPGPYELLLMSLGACTALTLRLYARRKQWPLERVIVRLAHTRDYTKDCVDCDTKSAKLEHIDCEIEIFGALSDEQRARLLVIANSCPVHRTLSSPVDLATTLKPTSA